MPRFQAAVGQPGAAFESIAEWLNGTASDAYALWGNPTDGLFRSSAWLATDPLQITGQGDVPDALAIDDLEIRTDALIVTARLLAQNGDDDRARAMFALAWDIVYRARRHRRRYVGAHPPARLAVRHVGGAANNPAAHLRLAQGYAMLGDAATTGEVLDRYNAGPQLERGLAWPDPMDVAVVLVAASASGTGANAYAAAQEHVFTRSLYSYLLAVSIGLKHATISPFSGIPCATIAASRSIKPSRSRAFTTTGTPPARWKASPR